MSVHLALLFLIGASIGALGSAAARMRTHRARFNTVFAGVLGALIGGMSPGVAGSGSLLLGAMAAAALVVILLGLRHLLVHRA